MCWPECTVYDQKMCPVIIRHSWNARGYQRLMGPGRVSIGGHGVLGLVVRELGALGTSMLGVLGVPSGLGLYIFGES